MDAIAIGREAVPAGRQPSVRAALRRAFAAALYALLERIPADRRDVPPEFCRYPFP